MKRFRGSLGWMLGGMAVYLALVLGFAVARGASAMPAAPAAGPAAFGKPTTSSPIALSANNELLWVVNPPLFEYDEDKKTWAAAHHAFTRPHDECVEMLEKDPGKVLCYRYDLVLNGFEIGGGSIRLHDPEVQARVFRALGIDDEDARAKFGFLLDALRFGAPPHGGIAVGMDRLAMLLSGAESLRDVIPFPKTQKGSDLMTDAPTAVTSAQLTDLRIRVVE